MECIPYAKMSSISRNTKRLDKVDFSGFKATKSSSSSSSNLFQICPRKTLRFFEIFVIQCKTVHVNITIHSHG